MKRGVTYVLFGKRKGSHGEGTWGLPGGHLEFGESLLRCAVREVREETGIELDPARVKRAPLDFTNDIFPREGVHYITLFLVAEIDERQEAKLLEPERCEEWRWHPFSEQGIPTPAFLPVYNWFDPGSDQLADDWDF